MSAEMKRLAAAHAKVRETEAQVSAAVKTEAAAKALLDNIERELDKHQRRHVGMAADYVAVRETEHRRDAARIAVDKLGAEVEAAHEAAKTAVVNEARAILAREAEEYAERVAVLEGQAFEFRTKLEGAARSGVFGWRPLSLSDLSQRILRENNSLPFGSKNTEPFVSENQNAEPWRQRLSQLLNP
jgi:hypothetical protein